MHLQLSLSSLLNSLLLGVQLTLTRHSYPYSLPLHHLCDITLPEALALRGILNSPCFNIHHNANPCKVLRNKTNYVVKVPPESSVCSGFITALLNMAKGLQIMAQHWHSVIHGWHAKTQKTPTLTQGQKPRDTHSHQGQAPAFYQTCSVMRIFLTGGSLVQQCLFGFSCKGVGRSD